MRIDLYAKRPASFTVTELYNQEAVMFSFNNCFIVQVYMLRSVNYSTVSVQKLCKPNVDKFGKVRAFQTKMNF